MKFILIAILIFLLIRMIVQGVVAYYAGVYEGNHKNQDRRKEGEVTIEDRPKLEKKISKDDGQYVDYEEIN